MKELGRTDAFRLYRAIDLARAEYLRGLRPEA